MPQFHMMHKFFITFIITGILMMRVQGQLPTVNVADNTLKVAAFGEEVFYYGFAEGDQVIFNFEELKGKELKEVEIIELPAYSKFMDYKTSKIGNKVLEITRTGVYKFRFANSGLGGRICKFKIERIPASASTQHFNSNVYWRTVYDSTRATVQEKYLINRAYKPVQLLEPSEFYINSGRNATFQGGKSRITLPVIIPLNTVEWYYTFSATRNEKEMKATKQTFNLLGQLTKAIPSSGLLDIGLDMLTKPPGADVCDIYLLDQTNREPFEQKAEYRFRPEGSRENIASGVVKIKSTLSQVNYLGIKNPDAGYGIHVLIEAVAITLVEEWGVRDVIRYNVSSRQEAYLRN